MKDILRMEWQKLFLPIVLMASFLFLVYLTYDELAFIDENACEIMDIFEFLIAAGQGDLVLLDNETLYHNMTNTTYTQAQFERWDMLINETEYLVGGPSLNPGPLIFLFGLIDPIYPKPCELSGADSGCYWYISEDAYDCMGRESVYTEAGDGFFVLYGFMGYGDIPAYRSLDIGEIALNLVFLFIEGYLVSALLLYGYRRHLRPDA